MNKLNNKQIELLQEISKRLEAKEHYNSSVEIIIFFNSDTSELLLKLRDAELYKYHDIIVDFKTTLRAIKDYDNLDLLNDDIDMVDDEFDAISLFNEAKGYWEELIQELIKNNYQY